MFKNNCHNSIVYNCTSVYWDIIRFSSAYPQSEQVFLINRNPELLNKKSKSNLTRINSFLECFTITVLFVRQIHLAHLLTMAGVMFDSFHLSCFLSSSVSWLADISLWSMKLTEIAMKLQQVVKIGLLLWSYDVTSMHQFGIINGKYDRSRKQQFEQYEVTCGIA